MNGRNKDQQQEALPRWTEHHIAAAPQKIEKDFIGRRVLVIIIGVAKFLDEFGSGRKRGQYCAGNSESPEFFVASIIAEFGDEARL